MSRMVWHSTANDISIDDTNQGGSDGFTETFASSRILAPNIAPKLQVTPHTQPVSDLSSGSSTSMGYYDHVNIGTNVSISNLSWRISISYLFIRQLGNALVSSSSFSSIKDGTNPDDNERQPPVVTCRPPEKKGSGLWRPRRACVNIEGLLIDKDDLYPGAGHGSSMISVHECRWAAPSNPCGMWIICSKSRVGAHIRKWHPSQNATTECLWDGCTRSKAMRKDSINRHVVTVHLGEGFRCQGCDQEFPRKDVYNLHADNRQACRDAGVAMVYGTECKVIDTRQVSH